MNHFMARLIFCFFAEDTDIFNGRACSPNRRADEREGLVQHARGHQPMFRAMNTKLERSGRRQLPRWADHFPYVNGGLFSGSDEVPRFSKIARSYLLHVGKLDWTRSTPTSSAR
jgi:hypothetical protein